MIETMVCLLFIYLSALRQIRRGCCVAAPGTEFGLRFFCDGVSSCSCAAWQTLPACLALLPKVLAVSPFTFTSESVADLVLGMFEPFLVLTGCDQTL